MTLLGVIGSDGVPIASSISGRVTNDSGDPMPNVIVSTGPYNSAIINASGVYPITGLITGTYTITPSGHKDEVNIVAFSPDGKTLASGSRDDTVKLWEVK